MCVYVDAKKERVSECDDERELSEVRKEEYAKVDDVVYRVVRKGEVATSEREREIKSVKEQEGRCKGRESRSKEQEQM